jgi:hypothetical protein
MGIPGAPIGVPGPYSIGEVPAKVSLALVVDTLKPRSFGWRGRKRVPGQGDLFLYGLFLFLGVEFWKMGDQAYILQGNLVPRFP